MSRLDDELKLLLRREEPSPDFVDRVMSRINHPAPRKAAWWRRLFESVQPPTLRWVAAGVAASLLFALFGLQFGLRQVRTEEQPQQASALPAPPQPPPVVENLIPQPPPVKREADHPKPVRQRRRQPQAETLEDRIAREEGERAKQQLMKALEIASSTLNEAQRIIVQSED
ncbi:MAG TPA: hypothetical protein VNO70_23460 [Blastocatellia bacterium]|nr:hypothetical protein [Blastocatellia bacterium]